MPSHAYSTYIKTSNQANRDQKPIKNAQTTLKPRNLQQKLRRIFSKILAKRVYDSPPTPKSHNDLIGSRGATSRKKNTNIKNKETKQDTNIYELTRKSKA